MNWIELNNQVIIKDEFGRYQLEKDKEALKSYIEEYVKPKLSVEVVPYNYEEYLENKGKW